MAEYWAREEKVEAIQYTGDNLDDLIRWACDQFENGSPMILGGYRDLLWVSRNGNYADTKNPPKIIEEGDYICVHETGEFSVLSERDFTRRYYRRPL